jgi:hypothetical protein
MLKEAYGTFSFNILCATPPKQVPSPGGKEKREGVCLLKNSTLRKF